MNIFPYIGGSKSVKLLAAALDAVIIRRKNSKFKGRANKTVINWGAGTLPPEVEKCNVVNANSRVASNKLHTFAALKGKPYCLPFVTKKEDAAKWFAEFPKATVVCRTLVSSHSGKGIVLADNVQQLVDAKLYTLYIPKKDEYRIHVAFGEVIHKQRKARNRAVPDEKVDWKVRSHLKGFIFVQEGVVPPDCVLEAAVDAVKTCNLDFAGVDVIYNEKQGKAYVVEVNSAPGIEGTTVEKYRDVFKRHLNA